VVVSDYKAGDPASLEELGLTFDALARQDFAEPVEMLVVLSAASAEAVPADVLRRLPGLRIVSTSGLTSYDLKNDGAREAQADIVLLLDADCAPVRGWLKAAVDHMRAHPRAAVVSGRTIYKGERLVTRLFGLLDRAYVDIGQPGVTTAISNNNAVFRRDVLLRRPLTNDIGPFGSRPHADAILADGCELRFEPAMVTAHGFEGVPMARDIRRGQGFAMFRYRQLAPRARHGWIVRLGYAGIPIMLGMSVLHSWWRCLKLGRHYGIRWHQLPLALPLAVGLHALEVPGMVAAVRGKQLNFGVYR
jgi:hypothetical protein